MCVLLLIPSVGSGSESYAGTVSSRRFVVCAPKGGPNTSSHEIQPTVHPQSVAFVFKLAIQCVRKGARTDMRVGATVLHVVHSTQYVVRST